jgi:hypothetical protein
VEVIIIEMEIVVYLILKHKMLIVLQNQIIQYDLDQSSYAKHQLEIDRLGVLELLHSHLQLLEYE